MTTVCRPHLTSFSCGTAVTPIPSPTRSVGAETLGLSQITEEMLPVYKGLGAAVFNIWSSAC